MVKRFFILSWILVLFLFFSIEAHGEELEGDLYSLSAVLMDGESGRILYEKNGKEFLSNASTTKILTCILALEEGKQEGEVIISEYAASMPDVQLNVRAGERYYLKDLLYSLMLESHNDVAVAIAEHLAGSCENFSKKMNQKAREIGCKNTFFLTPNGLDATLEGKNHGTTAEDLSLIMRYCITKSPKKEEFLKITGTKQYNFKDVEEKRNFSCYNRNSFLTMMEGAISGKTGFTSKAGYCYVGALKQEERCYIVALLGCGWPSNKNYKWMDCKKLMEYGLQNYQYYSIDECSRALKKEIQIPIKNGKNKEGKFFALEELEPEKMEGGVLLKEGEKVQVKVEFLEKEAPLEKGEVMGMIKYLVGQKELKVQKLYLKAPVEAIDYQWCLSILIKRIFLLKKV